MKDEKELVNWLMGHDLMREGHRNDDAVNLAILSVIQEGLPSNPLELRDNMIIAASTIGASFAVGYDTDDFMDRIVRILPYLSGWQDDGIIYYAID